VDEGGEAERTGGRDTSRGGCHRTEQVWICAGLGVGPLCAIIEVFQGSIGHFPHPRASSLAVLKVGFNHPPTPFLLPQFSDGAQFPPPRLQAESRQWRGARRTQQRRGARRTQQGCGLLGEGRGLSRHRRHYRLPLLQSPGEGHLQRLLTGE